jgi:malate dehydrogenase
MPFVAILGAGPLGGALAHALADRARFDEVRLIDPEKTLAAGKALDILQAGPVDGYSTRVTGHASLDAAGGAWVVLLADPIQPDPLNHLKQLHRQSPGAVLVCADAAHQTAIGRAVATGAVPPDRLVGAAPFAAESAARALLALDADLSPSAVQVGITCADAGPAACRVDWSRTTVDGTPAEVGLHREQRSRLDARLSALWPPGPLTLAAAAARVAEAAWFGARQVFPCWWVTDGGATAPAVHGLRFAPGGRAKAVTAIGAAALATGPGPSAGR